MHSLESIASVRQPSQMPTKSNHCNLTFLLQASGQIADQGRCQISRSMGATRNKRKLALKAGGWHQQML